MSQSTLTPRPPETPTPEVSPADRAEPPTRFAPPPTNEFDYKPIPVLAPVTFFLGLASFSSLMGVFGWGVSVVGVLVGVASLFTISRSDVPLSGKPLTIAGMVLCVVFLALGVTFQIRDYHAELPPGFARVNFPRDIAEKKFITEDGQRKLHPDVAPLVDQKVYLKGYVWQSKKSVGLTEFVLLKDNGECCFGGDPAPYDMIEVHLTEGKTFSPGPSPGLIGVAGVLKADTNAPYGLAVYTFEAEHVAKAKTSW